MKFRLSWQSACLPGWRFPSTDSIVQMNTVSHTGASGLQRLANQALFAGEVKPQRRYLVVDYFVGQGGTLANLIGFIASHGAATPFACAHRCAEFLQIVQCVCHGALLVQSTQCLHPERCHSIGSQIVHEPCRRNYILWLHSELVANDVSQLLVDAIATLDSPLSPQRLHYVPRGVVRR